MTSEEWDRYEEGRRLARIAVIAQMAATLMASAEADADVFIGDYVNDATSLYDAVEASDRARQQQVPENTNA